jgi:hypothetical protein
VTTAWRTGDDPAPSAYGRPTAPALRYPSAATERLATATDITGHADATVHIPALVGPVEDADSYAPRRRWDGVAAMGGGPVPVASRTDHGHRVVGPLTAAAAVPAPPAVSVPPAASRRARTITTRVAALIAAAAFVVGAASAVLVGAISGPGGPPAGAGATPPGISAPGDATSSGADSSGTTSST